MTNKEKIEKFKTFKQGLQILPYTNPKEMEYYHKVIATHLKEITTQRELNLNQYFDTENQRKDRQKLFDAIKYIEAVEDSEFDLIPDLRIIIKENTFENFAFSMDTKVKMEKKTI